MSTAQVVYDCAVLCEDIRQEITHKFFLIGVISSELLLQALPSVISICIYSEGTVIETGEFQSKIKVIDDVGNILWNGAFGVLYNFVEGRFSQADRLQLMVQREGLISFIAIDGSSKEQTLLKRQVKLVPISDPRDDIATMLGISP
jgi:hypothetical protein